MVVETALRVTDALQWRGFCHSMIMRTKAQQGMTLNIVVGAAILGIVNLVRRKSLR